MHLLNRVVFLLKQILENEYLASIRQSCSWFTEDNAWLPLLPHAKSLLENYSKSLSVLSVTSNKPVLEQEKKHEEKQTSLVPSATQQTRAVKEVAPLSEPLTHGKELIDQIIYVLFGIPAKMVTTLELRQAYLDVFARPLYCAEPDLIGLGRQFPQCLKVDLCFDETNKEVVTTFEVKEGISRNISSYTIHRSEFLDRAVGIVQENGGSVLVASFFRCKTHPPPVLIL